jgi:vacuolar-type H+-ATPase subunit D/Vma8
MPISTDNNFDRQTLNRIANLEERIRDMFTAQGKLVSLLEVQELLVVLGTQLESMQVIINSLEARIAILEDIPEIV